MIIYNIIAKNYGKRIIFNINLAQNLSIFAQILSIFAQKTSIFNKQVATHLFLRCNTLFSCSKIEHL